MIQINKHVNILQFLRMIVILEHNYQKMNVQIMDVVIYKIIIMIIQRILVYQIQNNTVRGRELYQNVINQIQIID